MKKQSVLLLTAAAVLVAITLGIAAGFDRARAPALKSEAQEDWSAAVAHLEKGDATHAKANLIRWMEAAKAKGIRSPEAHYNLAIAHWALKEPGPAATELLRSLLISQSFTHIARAQSAVAGMQRELGVSDSVAREGRFLARVWFTDNGITFLFTLALWSVVGISLWLWKRWKIVPLPAVLGWLALPVLVILVAGSALALRDWNGGYAVLDATEGAVGLFPDPRIDTQEKLLDLPSGTLVHSTGETQNGFLRIDSPIVAWVQAPQVKLPD